MPLDFGRAKDMIEMIEWIDCDQLRSLYNNNIYPRLCSGGKTNTSKISTQLS